MTDLTFLSEQLLFSYLCYYVFALWFQITTLNLDGQQLTRLSNLDQLVNLRWASFDNNEISHIEGLEHWPLLEELSLNCNNISRLEGAESYLSLSITYLLALSV